MSVKQTRKPLEIKISTVVAIVAVIADTDHVQLSAALAQLTGGTPDYFEDELTLLDFAHLPACAAGSIDWPALLKLFHEHRLNPVAVRHAPSHLEAEIRAQGLAIENIEVARAASVSTPAPAPTPAQAELVLAPQAPVEPSTAKPLAGASQAAQATAPNPTMVIDTPVRSGQRVYARGCDLVLMATVNPGAEVIADGSIHVYAPLRGRALAGASGLTTARIFALAMEAELVSIAGVYRTFDEGWQKELAGKPAQVQLNDERLDIKSLQVK
jgi:septum site-determining protein MinC